MATENGFVEKLNNQYENEGYFVSDDTGVVMTGPIGTIIDKGSGFLGLNLPKETTLIRSFTSWASPKKDLKVSFEGEYRIPSADLPMTIRYKSLTLTFFLNKQSCADYLKKKGMALPEESPK